MSEVMETIKIDAVAFGGAGIGKMPSGKLCFVRGVIPGETVRVQITAEKKSFAEGRLVEIITPAPERITPECPLAVQAQNAGADCQGCSYQHMPYEMELEWKQKQLNSFLIRSHLVQPEIMLSPFGSPARFHWRNRIKLSCAEQNGTTVQGYKMQDNHTILPLKSCPLARKDICTLMEQIADKADETGGAVYYRWTQHDGALRWTAKQPPERSVLEKLGDFGLFGVHATSFFQTNPAVALELAKRIADAVKTSAPEYFLELYCGAGVFSLIAAGALETLKCTGVELDKPAVESARNNTMHRKLDRRCRFLRMDAAKYLAEQVKKGLPPHTMVLVDPPRTGLDPKMLTLLRDSGASEIVYISCAPDTLKRDLETLCEAFVPVSAGLLDMFPCTAHFESMVLLRNKNE